MNIVIARDPIPHNPRVEDDNDCVMVFDQRKTPWNSSRQTFGDVNDWSTYGFVIEQYDSPKEFIERVQARLSEDDIVARVVVNNGNPDEELYEIVDCDLEAWPGMAVGVIFVTFPKTDFITGTLPESCKQEALESMESELKRYTAYVNGDVYRWIAQNGAECGDFLSEEEAKADAEREFESVELVDGSMRVDEWFSCGCRTKKA